MISRAIFLSFLLFAPSIIAIADEAKLIGTAGLTQIEGAGGGGIVPWATITGYESSESYSASVSSTQVYLDDFRLRQQGVSFGLFDRVELSYSRHNFDLGDAGGEIRQDIFASKIRLYGDLVYSDWPQLSVGIQYKKLIDGEIAELIGATNHQHGTDIYLAATKVHLAAVAGYNLVWNIALRSTDANQLGLLGFGGENGNRKIVMEGSLGVFFSPNLAVGFEYRHKPDNLLIKEDDWQDFFVAYIPNKNFNLTLAWASLGSIAGAPDQNGVFLSMTGYLK